MKFSMTGSMGLYLFKMKLSMAGTQLEILGESKKCQVMYQTVDRLWNRVMDASTEYHVNVYVVRPMSGKGFMDTIRLESAQVASMEEIGLGDLPLYVSWPYKTDLFLSKLKEGL